jgi:hypothetical protein
MKTIHQDESDSTPLPAETEALTAEPLPERTPRDPQQILAQAELAAQALAQAMAGKPRRVILNGSEYLEFEDWQTLAGFYGLATRTQEAEPIEIFGCQGAKAKAVVCDRENGVALGGAEAYCLSSEEGWADKPWFQLASMAQTRAGAKALRNLLAWVAVRAGFKPTPAEEMIGAKKEPMPSSPVEALFQRFSGLPIPKPAENTAVNPSLPESTAFSVGKPKQELSKAELRDLFTLAKQAGFVLPAPDEKGRTLVDFQALGRFLKEIGLAGTVKTLLPEERDYARALLRQKACAPPADAEPQTAKNGN